MRCAVQRSGYRKSVLGLYQWRTLPSTHLTPVVHLYRPQLSVLGRDGHRKYSTAEPKNQDAQASREAETGEEAKGDEEEIFLSNPNPPWANGAKHIRYEEEGNQSLEISQSALKANLMSTVGQERAIRHSLSGDGLRFWAYLLQVQQRVHGPEGVYALWTTLRDGRRSLPSTGANANLLWTGFVEAAVQHDRLLDEILEYSEDAVKNHGRPWTFLYETLIIYTLRTDPSKAYDLHLRLQGWCPIPPGSFTRVALASPSTPSVLRNLRKLYKRARNRQLYEAIMPLLFRRGRHNAAYRWHQFLTYKDDLSEPTAARLKNLMPLPPDMNRRRRVRRARLNKLRKTRRLAMEKSSSPMVRYVQSMLASRGKPMSDSICARCLATHSISLDVIINGLYMFGVDQIGPLALRELAAREGSPQAVAQRISSMAKIGISIGTSIFSRLVAKFSSEGQSELLEDLVNSDQHPDELKNTALQKALLVEYLRKGDSRLVRKTLAVLTAFDVSARRLEQHLLLEAHLSLNNIEAAIRVLNEMHEAGTPADASAFDALLQKQVSRYTWRRAPVQLRAKEGEPLAVNLLLSALRSGVSLDPKSWRRIIYRLGRAKDLDELEKVVCWLASFYGARRKKESRRALVPSRLATAGSSRGQQQPRQQVRSTDALRDIFLPRVQKQLIVWGLLSAIQTLTEGAINGNHPTTGDHEEGGVLADKNWTYGLRLLRLLADHGMDVDPAKLGRFYLRQLAVLNGTSTSSEAWEAPRQQLTDDQLNLIIRDAQEIWGGKLFPGSGGTTKPR
ncbi:MAG: hypothetical protein M1823_001043 [Watsoniomyces obsoletus]|nr:MAG: hypothetical protein M1823_001043 [Watsoniomyces obsoletus]